MTLALPDDATGRGPRLAAAGENLTVQPASTCPPELAAKQQHCAVTQQDLRELFGNGAYTLSFAKASAKPVGVGTVSRWSGADVATWSAHSACRAARASCCFKTLQLVLNAGLLARNSKIVGKG
jgi:hypothetical protein